MLHLVIIRLPQPLIVSLRLQIFSRVFDNQWLDLDTCLNLRACFVHDSVLLDLLAGPDH